MRDGILYVDATAHYSSLEGLGIHLFNYMARRLRSALIDLEMWDPSRSLRDDQVPVGPEFVYGSASAIFGGRSGQGPQGEVRGQTLIAHSSLPVSPA
jgi:hypothetical protein